MAYKILQLGDPKLTRKSDKIADFELESLQKLIDGMVETCEKGKEFTAGLAAPQVGENLRLTVINKAIAAKSKAKRDTTDWTELINPRVVEVKGNEESLIWEACLSVGVGDNQLWGPVWRPDWVVVEYEDRHGKLQHIEGKGFFSHLLQHEIDHLNGILFISRVRNPEHNLWKSKDLDTYIEKNDHYPKAV